jgi:hypothetical protein
MLAADGFSEDNWNVRNSALMAFTSLTKRIFPTSVQEQDLAKGKGRTIIDFFTKEKALYKFFLGKI